MKRIALLLALSATGLAQPAAARALAPTDFAYGLELSVDASDPLQALTLPSALLDALVDPELGDACLFDAQGRQVAHAVTFPDERPEPVEDVLPHYPLERPAEATAPVSVAVERDARGAIVRAFAGMSLGASVDSDARVVSYLLDCTGTPEPLEALTLGLSAASPFTVRVEVEAGEDLDAFRPLATATLARLEHAGRTLRRDVVTLPSVRARYLRLNIHHPPNDLTLSLATALVHRIVAQHPRHTRDLAPRAVPNADGQQVFRYVLTGAARPDRYQVLLPVGTSLVDGTLESSLSEAGPYHTRARALHQRGDDTPRALAAERDRFFQLRIGEQGGGVHGGAPVLRLAYLAPRLLFRADGEAPYLLAYGSALARCRKFDDRELLTLSPDLRPTHDTARVVRRRTLAGEAARTPEPRRPLRTYALWAVLLIAVATLALIARRLLKSV